MKNLTQAIVTFGLLSLSCLPVNADDDNHGSGSQSQNQTQQQTANNTNLNINSNINTNRNNNRLTSRSSSNNVNTSSANLTVAEGNNSSTNNNSYNNLQYPNWVNVTPSQSSVGIDAVVCQGATLTGGVSTLTTSIENNNYGVQGTLGFSVPLTGQDDCRAISAAIKKRASIENASRTLLACHQLKLARITPDLTKFPELAACN
jgi:hypothetical protein